MPERQWGLIPFFRGDHTVLTGVVGVPRLSLLQLGKNKLFDLTTLRHQVTVGSIYRYIHIYRSAFVYECVQKSEELSDIIFIPLCLTQA